MDRSSRRNFFRSLFQGMLGTGLLAAAWQLEACVTPANQGLAGLLKAAGNATDEAERLKLLRKAAELPDLATSDRELLEQLIDLSRHFAEPREIYESLPENKRPKRYLSGFFKGHLPHDEYLLPQVDTESPFAPLNGFYRARMLIHSVIQHGWLLSYPEERAKYYGPACELLKQAATAFPENQLIGMYLGKPIPWQASFDSDPNAPQWANQQREILEKLTNIIHWWIDERLVSDGQFGGGWGDDVEMWRNFIPVMVAFEDEKIIAGQEKLSEGLFAQPHMAGGYTNHMTDVEHTAEDSADTCTAMMHLKPNDPVWQQRAMRIFELMETVWTGKNEQGFLQFKSTYFTSEGVDPDPRKACDTVYHPRTIQPALLHWQRTGDARIGKLVTEWMKTWVKATTRTEKGKPPGIVPSAIHWPDGRVGGLPNEWWHPDNHNENPLYDWPSAMYMMLSTLLLCFHMTKDRYYLGPLLSMAAIYRKHLPLGDTEKLEKGSESWCASQMPRFLPEALAKYQKITGDRQFEDIIQADADGYAQMILTGDRQALEKYLATQHQVFSRDEAAFTSEVLWTDRLFSFHKSFLNLVDPKPLPTFQADVLFGMVTGHMGDAMYFPINAVRWHMPSREIAILVTKAEKNHFEAELYHFGAREREIAATFFLLESGEYLLKLFGDTDNQPLLEEEISLSTDNRRLSCKIPAQTLIHLKLVRG